MSVVEGEISVFLPPGAMRCSWNLSICFSSLIPPGSSFCWCLLPPVWSNWAGFSLLTAKFCHFLFLTELSLVFSEHTQTSISSLLKSLQQVPVTLRIKFKVHAILCKPYMSCSLGAPLLTHTLSSSQSDFLAAHWALEHIPFQAFFGTLRPLRPLSGVPS